MWSACVFSCVSVCPLAWMQVVSPVNSGEGRIDSKPDVKCNLSLGHVGCGWGKSCSLCAQDGVKCVCAAVHKARACKQRSKVLQVRYIWKGIPWAWIVCTDWPRCVCHAILMPLPANWCGWRTEGVEMCASARVSFWSDPKSSSNIPCTHSRGFNPSWC